MYVCNPHAHATGRYEGIDRDAFSEIYMQEPQFWTIHLSCVKHSWELKEVIFKICSKMWWVMFHRTECKCRLCQQVFNSISGLCFLLYILYLRAIKSNEMMWGDHAAHVWGKRSIYSVSFGRYEGKRLIERLKLTCQNKIKVGFTEIGLGCEDYSHLTPDSEKWLFFRTLINLRIPWNFENVLTSLKSICPFKKDHAHIRGFCFAWAIENI